MNVSESEAEEAPEDAYARKVVETAVAVMQWRGWKVARRFGARPDFPDRIVFGADMGPATAELVFVHDPHERILDEGAYEAATRTMPAEGGGSAGADGRLALRVVVIGRVKPGAEGRHLPAPCGLYGCQMLRRAKKTGATTLLVRGASRQSGREKAVASVYARNARWTSTSLELLPAAYLYGMELPDASSPTPYVAADVSDVLLRLGLRSKAQLPRVLPHDVVVVLLGAKTGDVVLYPPDAGCPGFTARLVCPAASTLDLSG